MQTGRILVAGAIGIIALGASALLWRQCAEEPTPKEEIPRGGYLILAGERVWTEAPLVNFEDEGGYDARLETCWFDRSIELPTQAPRGADTKKRYGDRSVIGLKPELQERVQTEGFTKATLAERVDQFVLHYDVAGVSRSCFKVLHDIRGLSVHFLLDLDGTVYQTLDLALRARHATIANDRSIGVEIAQMGAYTDPKTLDTWYKRHADQEVRIQLAKWQGDGGFRRKGFIPRPARNEPIVGEIHGTRYHQYDFTPEQYNSLVLLSRTLAEVFPKLSVDAPRGADGTILKRALDPEEFLGFQGFLGHFHVQRGKQDPGPAFRWEEFLHAVRAKGEPGF